MAKGGGLEIGATKRGKGMKIMAIVDRHGLPLSVSTHAANHHEVRLVQLCFDFYMIEAKPENLIGDRAYDSDPLDAELQKDGIEMIAPHRCNRSKPPTQDRRRLSRYMRRWLVERFFAWIQWQHRILIRWEYHANNFLGFVQLACLVSSSNDFEMGSSKAVAPTERPQIAGIVILHLDAAEQRRLCCWRTAPMDRKPAQGTPAIAAIIASSRETGATENDRLLR
jgi:transposase